jgi:hypothetical protein
METESSLPCSQELTVADSRQGMAFQSGVGRGASNFSP